MLPVDHGSQEGKTGSSQAHLWSWELNTTTAKCSQLDIPCGLEEVEDEFGGLLSLV